MQTADKTSTLYRIPPKNHFESGKHNWQRTQLTAPTQHHVMPPARLSARLALSTAALQAGPSPANLTDIMEVSPHPCAITLLPGATTPPIAACPSHLPVPRFCLEPRLLLRLGQFSAVQLHLDLQTAFFAGVLLALSMFQLQPGKFSLN